MLSLNTIGYFFASFPMVLYETLVTLISRDNRRDLRKVCTREVVLKLQLVSKVMKKYLQNGMALSFTI